MDKKLVLFDIDGTLLYTTNKTYRNRFEHAMTKVYGVTHPVDWETIEGHTDTTVFLDTLSKKGFSREQIQAKISEAFDASHEHFVQNANEAYSEAILPGAKDILEKLKDTVSLGILTGNYEKTAWHKLDLVGLKDYFAFGLFGHEAEDRPSLARLVHKKAKAHFDHDFPSEDIYFIGDTPKDIACAREINAHIISVTTGKYSKDELLSYHPDLLVENLMDPKIINYIQKG